jgi:hypothetical protein
MTPCVFYSGVASASAKQIAEQIDCSITSNEATYLLYCFSNMN